MNFDWTTEYGEIIQFLLDCLEEEHMGISIPIWQEVEETWNIEEYIFPDNEFLS